MNAAKEVIHRVLCSATPWEEDEVGAPHTSVDEVAEAVRAAQEEASLAEDYAVYHAEAAAWAAAKHRHIK